MYLIMSIACIGSDGSSFHSPLPLLNHTRFGSIHAIDCWLGFSQVTYSNDRTAGYWHDTLQTGSNPDLDRFITLHCITKVRIEAFPLPAPLRVCRMSTHSVCLTMTLISINRSLKYLQIDFTLNILILMLFW